MPDDANTAQLLLAAILANDAAGIHNVLNAGADINARDDKGFTPLQYAVRSGKAEAVSALLERSADIEMPAEPSLETALHCAVRRRSAEIVEMLLDKGAEPDAANALGRGPLHVAAEAGDVALCKQLVAAGARVALADKEGKTPRDLTTQRAAQEVDNGSLAETLAFLQQLERERGLDRAFNAACRAQVAKDVAVLKSHGPARFKVQPAALEKTPLFTPKPPLPL